jgi:hypothetical protein
LGGFWRFWFLLGIALGILNFGRFGLEILMVLGLVM